MDKEDKKFYADTAIKIGVTIFAVYAINEALTFGKPGRVDRVKFDLEKTQNRYFPTGHPPPNDFDVVADPWNPSDLARRAYTAMNGLQSDDEDRNKVFAELNALGMHRARWMHNYWLAQIDPKETLYRWVNGEMMVSKNKLMLLHLLREWGIGF